MKRKRKKPCRCTGRCTLEIVVWTIIQFVFCEPTKLLNSQNCDSRSKLSFSPAMDHRAGRTEETLLVLVWSAPLSKLTLTQTSWIQWLPSNLTMTRVTSVYFLPSKTGYIYDLYIQIPFWKWVFHSILNDQNLSPWLKFFKLWDDQNLDPQ